MRDEDVVAAARAMRAQFRPLAEGISGAQVAALDALLARAEEGEQVASAIFDLLASSDVTREELGRRVTREQDTVRTTGEAFYSGLPGHPHPSSEIVYRCSVCEYEYPIFEVGESIPDGCPHGHGPLVRIA